MPRFGLLWIILVLAACSGIPLPQERFDRTDAIASAKGWQQVRIPAGSFDLTAYVPRSFHPDKSLTIYIEGDGFAWVSGNTPSTDPTPREPIALKLALAHPIGNAAYLARPCQYIDAERSGCEQRYWTGARFAPEVIDAASVAVDQLKRRFSADSLVLVGYSGGGAVAALLSAQRSDVLRLVTVAGNLDHRAWTTYHRIQALSASLNAADVADRLTVLPQSHYIGAEDRVITPELARRWPPGFLGDKGRNLIIVPKEGHACCWADQWANLFQHRQ